MKAWLAGAVLIVATNAVALLGVAYNRSGEPESRLVLTERELRVERWGEFDAENSGLSLTLSWRAPFEFDDAEVPGRSRFYRGWTPWLDVAKLSELGFDMSGSSETANAARDYERQRVRDVLLVLELGGAAHARALELAKREVQRAEAIAASNPGESDYEDRADRARVNLAAEAREASRLFVIDAGLEARVLRERYPDQTRHVLLGGQVGVGNSRSDGDRALHGYVSALSIGSIHVSADLLERHSFGDGWRKNVVVAFGKRFEPWIVEIGDRK